MSSKCRRQWKINPYIKGFHIYQSKSKGLKGGGDTCPYSAPSHPRSMSLPPQAKRMMKRKSNNNMKKISRTNCLKIMMLQSKVRDHIIPLFNIYIDISVGALIVGLFTKDQRYLDSLSPKKRARILADRERRRQEIVQCEMRCSFEENLEYRCFC